MGGRTSELTGPHWTSHIHLHHTSSPKPSHNGSVSDFWAQTPRPPRVVQRMTPPPSPPHTRPTTSSHRLPPPFSISCPKSSPGGSVSRFWTKLLPLPRVRQLRHPTNTTASYLPSHRLPPLPPGAVSNGASITELRRLGFGVLTPHPRTHLRHRTATQITTTTTPPTAH
jgi:hypothetical protein